MTPFLTKEEQDALAQDFLNWEVCRHRWRFSGSQSFPEDPEHGFPASRYAVIVCRGLCQTVKSVPIQGGAGFRGARFELLSLLPRRNPQ